MDKLMRGTTMKRKSSGSSPQVEEEREGEVKHVCLDQDLKEISKGSMKRPVSPQFNQQKSKRRIIEDSVEQVLRDTIFQLSVNKLQFPRWKMHEPPLSRTVLIWNMVRVIDREIQEERVVDDVLSMLGGGENKVKFIKVCRADCLTTAGQDETDRLSTAGDDQETTQKSRDDVDSLQANCTDSHDDSIEDMEPSYFSTINHVQSSESISEEDNDVRLISAEIVTTPGGTNWSSSSDALTAV